MHLVLTEGSTPSEMGLELSTVRSEQVKVLVVRLAVAAPHTVRIDQLADALWLDDLPRTWATALRGVVAKARRWLSEAGLDASIERRSGGYALVLPAPWTTDLDAGRRALARADVAATEGDLLLAASAADEAVGWSSGSLLDGVDGDWLDAVRSELRQHLLASLGLLSSTASALGESSRAVAAARRLVLLEPFGEAGYRALMSALVQSGDRGGAAMAYEDLARSLRDELGVEPSLETETFRASLGADASTSRVGMPTRSGSVFVGRTAELQVLHDTYRDAVHFGARVAIVSGPAGIGKSSLTAELAASIEAEGGRVLVGRCSRTPAVPYEPIVEALERDLRSRSPDQRARVLRDVQPELVWAVPSIGPLIGAEVPAVDNERDRHRVLDAIAGHMRSLLVASPVVLVIDDVQWASEPTLLALRHLTERNDTGPLLVVLNERSGDNLTLPTQLADLRHRLPVIDVPLAGLPRDAIEQIVRRLEDVGTAELGRRVDRLLERTAGNPYFVKELLRAAEAGVPDADVPSGILGVVGLRLTMAGADATALVRTLAVLDDDAGLGLVRAVAGLDSPRFTRALDAATATGLVVLTPDRRQVRLAHGLAREAALAQIPAGELMSLHERAARSLERLQTAGIGVSAADLARHYTGAAALGHSERALHHAVAAARIDRAAGAPEDAVARLEVALTLDVGPASRAVALCELGSSLAQQGHMTAAQQYFADAADAAESVGDARIMALAALGSFTGGGGIATWVPDPTTVQLLHRALARIEPTEVALRIRLLGALSDTATGPSQWRRRHELAREALATAAGSDDPEVVSAALAAERIVSWRPEQAVERVRAGDLALATLAGSGASPESRVEVLLALANDSIVLGDRGAADQAIADVRRLAEPGNKGALWEADLIEVGLAAADGRFDDAQRLAVAAAGRWDLDHADAQRALIEQLGLITVFAGTGVGFDDTDLARRVGERPDIGAYLAAAPLVLVQSGRPEEATIELERIAAEGYSIVPEHLNWSFSMAMLAEATIRLDLPDRAAELRAMLEPSAGTWVLLHGPSMIWGCVDRLLGLLSAHLGEVDRAAAELRRAVAASRAFGASLWEERTSAELAALIQNDDDRRTRVEHTGRGGEGGI